MLTLTIWKPGRGPWLIMRKSFRSGRLACGDALSAALGRLLCKSRLRLLPLYTTTVVRCVISPAATAHRLPPRGRASNGEVEAPTSDTRRCVSAVALRVAEALAPRQDAHNLARNARVSVTTEIKMGVLLGRCPAGRQSLVT